MKGMGGQPSRVVAQLVAALGLLAEGHQAQLDWLARYLRASPAPTEGDFCVEELALQFEDSAQALPQFVQDGLLQAEQERLVATVTEQLSLMRDASRTHLWRPEALALGQEWAEVRARAARALDALKRP
jgi:hypothetical protein